MAWICVELIALWLGLPVLLWLEALPPAWRGFSVSTSVRVFANTSYANTVLLIGIASL